MNGGTFLIVAMEGSFLGDLTLNTLLVGSFVSEVVDNVVGNVGMVGFVRISRRILLGDKVRLVEDTEFLDPV